MMMNTKFTRGNLTQKSYIFLIVGLHNENGISTTEIINYFRDNSGQDFLPKRQFFNTILKQFVDSGFLEIPYRVNTIRSGLDNLYKLTEKGIGEFEKFNNTGRIFIEYAQGVKK
ncbi:MAG: hypothetical protein HC877_20650 [Thioploca sp.]|nr:hypothetical protein [Thioploca sp.]